MSKRAQIIIKGGRDLVGQPNTDEFGPQTRGQDISVLAVIDGDRIHLPCTGFVLRCDGRKMIATVNLIVDEVELTAIEIADGIHLRKKEPR